MNLRPLLAATAALPLFTTLAGAAIAAPATRTVRDDTQLDVTVAADSCRVISLAPGTTAMLYAVGAGQCLVGTIAHSKEPAEAAALTIVGDAETLDFEQLLTLRPSVVVVAVDVVQRVRIDRIRALGIPVYQVHVKRVAGMPESLRRLGQLTNTTAAAAASARKLDADLERIAATYRGRANLRVLYQIWDQPIYTIGGQHVITDALQLCGATNVFAELTTAAPAVTREAAVLRNPDLILVSAPPESAASWIAEWRRIPTLRAVQAGRLVAYADERMDRMGPSLVDATEGLCKVIDAARPR